MATAAKLAANFIHVDRRMFRAEADAREFRLNFLKYARHDHRLDRADVVNQAFGVVTLRAGAGKITFLQPEPRDLIISGQPEFAVNVLE